jgi:inositol phosphorylceramide mannosyltransferase catalytic subunit
MSTRNGIPKIIHQTWKDENIPKKWRKSPEEWKRLHPDWKYILWTDASIRAYIEKNRLPLLALHDNFRYQIQRADMIRYIVLYDFGGVYSDLDLYPVKNIEYALTKCDVGKECGSDAYFVYSANIDCYTNAFMVSRKLAPVWLEAMTAMHAPAPWWAFGKHLQVMTTTGPLMLTEVLRNTTIKFTVLPQKLFNPYNVADDLSAPRKDAILRTLEGGSWHVWDSTLYNFVFKHYVAVIVVAVIIFVAVIGIAVMYRRKYVRCARLRI